MAGIRCPSCGRMLNVPDEMAGQEAKCPMCLAIFSPEGGRPRQSFPVPDVPDPLTPWRPGGRRGDEPRPPDEASPWSGRRDAHELPTDPIHLAGNWLFGLSLGALIWNMTCGCAGLTMLASPDVPEEILFMVGSAYSVHLVMLVILLIASQSFRAGGRNRWLCWTGVFLALFELAFAASRVVILATLMDSKQASEAATLIGGTSALLSLALFCAGLYARGVLVVTKKPKDEAGAED